MSFSNLSNDIIALAIIHMNNRDVKNFSLTNKRFNELLESINFLTYLLRIEFNIKITTNHLSEYFNNINECFLNRYLRFRWLLRNNYDDDNFLRDLIYNKIKADRSDISFLCNYGNIDCIIDDREYEFFIERCLDIHHEYIIRALLNNDRYDPSINNNMLIVRASEKNMNEIVKILLKDKGIYPSDRVLFNASLNGCVELVDYLVKHDKFKINKTYIDIAGECYKLKQVKTAKILTDKLKSNGLISDNLYFLSCCLSSSLKEINLMLKDVTLDPSINNNCIIRASALYGNSDIVSLLLKDSRVDPSDNNNDAIILASKHGQYEVVRLLISDVRVDPSYNNNEAIILASKGGHHEVVKLLMSDIRVDPSDRMNLAISHSLSNNDLYTTLILYSDRRVKAGIKSRGLKGYVMLGILGITDILIRFMTPTLNDLLM